MIYSHANKACCCWWWSYESLWVIMGCTLHTHSSPRDNVFQLGNLRSRFCVNRKPQNVMWLHSWGQVFRSRFTFQCVWPAYGKVNSRTAFLHDLNIENLYSKPKNVFCFLFFLQATRLHALSGFHNKIAGKFTFLGGTSWKKKKHGTVLDTYSTCSKNNFLFTIFNPYY